MLTSREILDLLYTNDGRTVDPAVEIISTLKAKGLTPAAYFGYAIGMSFILTDDCMYRDDVIGTVILVHDDGSFIPKFREEQTNAHIWLHIWDVIPIDN